LSRSWLASRRHRSTLPAEPFPASVRHPRAVVLHRRRARPGP
jgi:hypothetical protein